MESPHSFTSNDLLRALTGPPPVRAPEEPYQVTYLKRWRSVFGRVRRSFDAISAATAAQTGDPWQAIALAHLLARHQEAEKMVEKMVEKAVAEVNLPELLRKAITEESPKPTPEPSAQTEFDLLDWLEHVSDDEMEATARETLVRETRKCRSSPPTDSEPLVEAAPDAPPEPEAVKVGFVWMSAAEAGLYVGCTSKTVQNWIRDGVLAYYDCNQSRYKFAQAELDAKREVCQKRAERNMTPN